MKKVIIKLKEFVKKHESLHMKLAPIYLSYKRYKKLFYKFIDTKKDNEKLMVDIGAGTCFHRHWRNMEFPTKFYTQSKLVGVDYKYDLSSNKRFPFPDNSVSFFNSSNTFEHIPQEFCEFDFNEIYRCLKPKGAFRIQVPDIDCVYGAFGRRDEQFFRKRFLSFKNMEESFLLYFAAYFKDKVSPEELLKNYRNKNKEEFLNFYTEMVPREYQKENSGNHINWWDYNKLSKMLTNAGFTNVYRASFNNSKFIELKEMDSLHPETSIFIEAIK